MHKHKSYLTPSQISLHLALTLLAVLSFSWPLLAVRWPGASRQIPMVDATVMSSQGQRQRKQRPKGRVFLPKLWWSKERMISTGERTRHVYRYIYICMYVSIHVIYVQQVYIYIYTYVYVYERSDIYTFGSCWIIVCHKRQPVVYPLLLDKPMIADWKKCVLNITYL